MYMIVTLKPLIIRTRYAVLLLTVGTGSKIFTCHACKFSLFTGMHACFQSVQIQPPAISSAELRSTRELHAYVH